MNKEKIIQEYEELEKQLELIAEQQAITKEELLKNLANQPLVVIQRTRIILKQTVPLLHEMTQIELKNKYGNNVYLFPVSNARKR